MYEIEAVSKEMFLEAFSGLALVRPDGAGVGYVDPGSMLPFVRKVQSELSAATGLDPSNPEVSIPTIIGTTQAVNFLRDYGNCISGPLLLKGFAETWAIGVAFGMLFEQERQAQSKGADELTKMLNWKAELKSELEGGRHLSLKL